ncbi:MAG: aspartate-semialdehyde dehydrogenase [Clostridia bacterium]|nr:aspartate-semialdehyde dehydrogenase [Clostridia bacterium]
MKQYNVALVGTGAVGSTILEVLEERNFPVKSLKLLATSRSAGNKVKFKGQDYEIEETTPQAFAGVDVAFFAGGAASKLFAKDAVKQGAVVIDNSSAFRLDPEVPLVVPEVNPEDVKTHQGIIANPNCSTIQMVVALKPIYDAVGIERVIVSTYQAVSGAGQEAMDELLQQNRDLAENKEVTPKAFPYQIAYNLIPHIDIFMENGYTKEEMKMVNETKKMFHDEGLAISATTVRVPILRSHSEAITIETKRKLSAEEARQILGNAPGIVVVDDPAELKYPMPLFVSHKDEVFVGRIREDLAFANGISMFVVADQLRKGAATNAVQIGELLVDYGLL